MRLLYLPITLAPISIIPPKFLNLTNPSISSIPTGKNNIKIITPVEEEIARKITTIKIRLKLKNIERKMTIDNNAHLIYPYNHKKTSVKKDILSKFSIIFFWKKLFSFSDNFSLFLNCLIAFVIFLGRVALKLSIPFFFMKYQNNIKFCI